MPAPVNTTVDWASLDAVWREGDGGAVRKVDTAAMAPVRVFAKRGIIFGAGKGPVYGIRIKLLFCIEPASIGRVEDESVEG